MAPPGLRFVALVTLMLAEATAFNSVRETLQG